MFSKFRKCNCGCQIFEVGGFGVDSCTACGLTVVGEIMDMGAYWPRDRIMPRQVYTRRKRFKKYLQRANRQQSANTVPKETWMYLFERAPFRTPGEVYACLKAARDLKRKCYDSLPLLCAHLCETPVPRLTEREVQKCLELFEKIDRAVEKGPFISYLYCLEYILTMVARRDMCPYINRIKCEKRRRAYKERLDKIFSVESLVCESVALQLQVPREPRLAPNGAPGLQVRDLTRQKPGSSVGAAPGGFRQIRFDEDLVEQDFGGALSSHFLEPNEVHGRCARALCALASETHPFCLTRQKKLCP